MAIGQPRWLHPDFEVVGTRFVTVTPHEKVAEIPRADWSSFPGCRRAGLTRCDLALSPGEVEITVRDTISRQAFVLWSSGLPGVDPEVVVLAAPGSEAALINPQWTAGAGFAFVRVPRAEVPSPRPSRRHLWAALGGVATFVAIGAVAALAQK